jgi:hypothetical protein
MVMMQGTCWLNAAWVAVSTTESAEGTAMEKLASKRVAPHPSVSTVLFMGCLVVDTLETLEGSWNISIGMGMSLAGL